MLHTWRKAALSLSMTAAAWALPLGTATAAEPLVAGTITSSPPFVSYESDGKTLQGIIVDLAAAMSKEMGREITFQQSPFSSLLPALQAGRINMIFSIMNDTVERQKLVDFVDFFNMGSTLLIQHGNPQHVTGMDESFCGKTVAVVRGSLQIAIAEKASAECQAAGKEPVTISQYATPADGRLQVQTGHAAGFFGNTPILAYIAKTVDGGKTFAIVSKEYAPLPLGIAVEKGNTPLRDALQKALNTLIRNGTYASILKNYGAEGAMPKEATINGVK
jgi:polar amino acid transport system substrate-binding protein